MNNQEILTELFGLQARIEQIKQDAANQKRFVSGTLNSIKDTIDYLLELSQAKADELDDSVVAAEDEIGKLIEKMKGESV